MYAGAYLGQILGGSGVIFLSAYLPFRVHVRLVAGSILAVMLFVGLPLREPETTAKPADEAIGDGGRDRRSRAAMPLRRIGPFAVRGPRWWG